MSGEQRPDGRRVGLHFGLEVEDLDEACQRLEAAHAKRLTQKDGIDVAMAPGLHRNFEMKWAGPDEVVFGHLPHGLGWHRVGGFRSRGPDVS